METFKVGAWSPEEYAYLRDHWEHQTEREIAAVLGRKPRPVGCMARYLGLRKAIRRKPGMRKYQVNERFFDTWSPPMAYVLGLILADGSLGSRAFEIVSNDVEMLHQVAAVMEATHPIQQPINRNVWRLRIGNVAMVTALRALSLTPNKSLTCTLPPVPDALFFHLVRGYFDGNGGFERRSIKFSSGSCAVLCDISARIARLLHMDVRPVKESHGTRNGRPALWYSLAYSSSAALRVADAMYADADGLYLARKHDAIETYRTSPRAPNPFKSRYDRHLISDAERLARKRLKGREKTARWRAKHRST
jgi:hypothetical protein